MLDSTQPSAKPRMNTGPRCSSQYMAIMNAVEGHPAHAGDRSDRFGSSWVAGCARLLLPSLPRRVQGVDAKQVPDRQDT
jgi:hypothetical protein